MGQIDATVFVHDALAKPFIFVVTGPAALVTVTGVLVIGICTFVAEEQDDDGRLRLLQLEGRRTDSDWEPAK